MQSHITEDWCILLRLTSNLKRKAHLGLAPVDITILGLTNPGVNLKECANCIMSEIKMKVRYLIDMFMKMSC